MKRVLITGAGSYIGMSVENWLKKWPDKYEVNTLDMRSPDWRERDFSGYDIVYHVAGIAHADIGKVTEKQKELYYLVNTKLAIETAKKAKTEGVKQFILMSSMIVYGGMEHITNNTEPKPLNFYGDSKWQADKGVRELETPEFKVAVLRPPMIYGKGSKGNYPVLSKMAKKLPIFPKVNNKRSMLHIDNLCEFVRLTIENEEHGVFFPQNEELVNTSEMVKLIAEVWGHKIWVTSLLAPAVWIGKRMPGKIGNMCRKAFGSSYYEPRMSVYSCLKYNLRTFKETISETEGR